MSRLTVAAVSKAIDQVRGWSRIIIAIAAFSVTPTSSQAVTIIDFDDRPGQSWPFSEGTPVAPEYLVSDAYLPQGVLFDSGGGGILIAKAANSVSGLNVAIATAAGPVVTYSEPAIAYFWSGAMPAVVDFVSITLTDTSTSGQLSAYSYDGTLLDSVSGSQEDILTVTSPGGIHRVEMQGNMAFDDFTFGDPIPIPEPSTALLLVLGIVGIATGRTRSAAR